MPKKRPNGWELAGNYLFRAADRTKPPEPVKLHTQPLLFSPYPVVTVKQPTLFDCSGPRESDETCPECGRPLVETVSGWWTCPAGCLRLLPQGGDDGNQ